MQAWEKHLVQPAFKAFFGARIGAIERKWPGFQRSRIMGHHLFNTASCSVTSMRISPFKRRRPSTRVPAEPANALGSDFTPMRFVTSKKAPPKPLIRGTKVWPALNAPANALKNSRIGRPFKGTAQWLAASWAHLLPPSTIGPHGRDCRR